MAKVPDFRRLRPEDYQDQKWIERLFRPLNTMLEQMASALNRAITFQQNCAAEVRTVRVDGSYPVKFSWPLTESPRIAWIGAIRPLDGIVITSPFSVVWEYADSSVVIRDIPGLPAGKFDVTLICMVG